MLEAKPLTFLWKHWKYLKWCETSLAVFRHHVPSHTIFSTKGFWQTDLSQLTSTPREQNLDWERGRMLRIFIVFQVIKFHCFLPAPPPPPHFYCFPFTTTTFLLFFHHHYHPNHISTVFPSPPPHFYCFPSTTTFLFFPSTTTTTSFSLFSSTRFYKRLPTAILSTFWSNVSCSEQQSWFSSAVSWLPCFLAPVSFKDSYFTTTTCTRSSLTQYTHGTHFHPWRK